MKKRLDNRGFTLVELIIAVAILAIAISPLVANFIQSSKLNLKGREALNAMNLAQDMMEGISGSTAEDVAKGIDKYITDPTNAQPLAGTIFPVSTTFASAGKISADGDKVFVYQFNNVKTADSPRNKYTVRMTMDPTTQTNFNGKELANISEINQYYDAIYTWNDAELSQVIADMRSEAADVTYDTANYKGKIMRTIRVKIENTGTATAPVYKIGVARDYQPTFELANRAGIDSDFVVTETTENISRMDADKLPKNIYIYYQGMQNSTYSGPLDTIKIDNTTGEEVTVYLVRIQEEGASGNASYDMNYGCQVYITSKDMMGAATEDVHIVSNLRYNLSAEKMRYNFRDETETGALIILAEEDYPLDDLGVAVKNSSYDRKRAVYYYNGTLLSESLYQTNFSAGYAKKEKNTLYSVLIEVFDESGKRVATYDGGLSN